MRICVMYKGELHKRNCFQISYLGSFRGAEIYKTELSEKLSQRRLAKCFRELKRLKISFVAARDGLFPVSWLSRFSLTAHGESSAKVSRISEMALLFAARERAPLSFFIRGGSFGQVSRIALLLLAETSHVAISCADSDAVAESVADFCGAVLKKIPREPFVEIFPAATDTILKFKDTTAGFHDFLLSLPPDFPFDIPRELHAQLASLLEAGGALREGEAVIQIL